MKYILFNLLKIIFRIFKISQITKFNIFNYELIRTKKFFKFQNIDNKNYGKFDNLIVNIASRYSMMNSKRLWNLIYCSEKVIKENIPGDFVECGVFKGGGIILMSSVINNKKVKKKVWAYDTFKGMTKPDEYDKDYANEDAMIHWKTFKKDNYNNWCYASLTDVKNNLKSASKYLNLNLDNILYIKGKVENTLKKKKNVPKKISVLRLDTDFYQSTKLELEILYPKLTIGGYLIIDDFGYWKGSKKACLEYFNNSVSFKQVDDSCVFLKKIK